MYNLHAWPAGGAAAREERTADVHALSLFDGRWRKVAVQASGPPPPVGRIGHAAVAIGGALLIHVRPRPPAAATSSCPRTELPLAEGSGRSQQ